MSQLQEEIELLEARVRHLKSGQVFCVYYGNGGTGSLGHLESLRVELRRKQVRKITTEALGKLAGKALDIRLRKYGRVHFLQFEDGNGKALTGRYFIRGHIYKNAGVNGRDAFGISFRRGYVWGAGFEEDDVNIDYAGNVLASGDEPKYTKWRNERNKRRAAWRRPSKNMSRQAQ